MKVKSTLQGLTVDQVIVRLQLRSFDNLASSDANVPCIHRLWTSLSSRGDGTWASARAGDPAAAERTGPRPTEGGRRPRSRLDVTAAGDRLPDAPTSFRIAVIDGDDSGPWRSYRTRAGSWPRLSGALRSSSMRAGGTTAEGNSPSMSPFATSSTAPL